MAFLEIGPWATGVGDHSPRAQGAVRNCALKKIFLSRQTAAAKTIVCSNLYIFKIGSISYTVVHKSYPGRNLFLGYGGRTGYVRVMWFMYGLYGLYGVIYWLYGLYMGYFWGNAG